MAAYANDATKRKLILHLQMAEQNWQCFAIHQQYMKPQSAGGITKLLVPDAANPASWCTILDPNKIELHLIQYCQQHFQMAQGSLYTVPPLAPLLHQDSITPFGKQILHGTANIKTMQISYYIKLLLQHQ